MEVARSVLSFENFWVLHSSCTFIEEETNSEVDLFSLPMYVDFDVTETKEGFFNVYLDVNINSDDNARSGYAIFVSVFGLFYLNEIDKLSQMDIEEYSFFSAVPMLLGSTRGFIQNLTSNGLYGQYLLPTINLEDLIDQKMENNDFSAPTTFASQFMGLPS